MDGDNYSVFDPKIQDQKLMLKFIMECVDFEFGIHCWSLVASQIQ